MSSESITAVVLDWNLPDHTIRCVESLRDDGIPADRIVVVENGSTSDNWSRVATALSSCVLVRIDTNIGFARATNIGVEALPADSYLVVNNDAYVHRPGSVSALTASLRGNGVGVVVPKLLNLDLSLQPSVVPFTTPVAALVRASGASRFVPDRWQPRLGTHWSHSWSREIEAATGAVMLVHRRVWERLGGFRVASFMYAEDLDLCWRASKLGWKTWFASESVFVHLSSTSADRQWDIRQRWQRVGQAEAQIIREHLSPMQATATLAVTQLGLAARVAYFNATGDSSAAERYRGFLQGLRTAPADEPFDPPTVWVMRP
jgi:N-acetylglucosaminyl-diphospho-decaprenol L-rhamnosyltransferase